MPNFLIGHGDTLVHQVAVKGGGGEPVFAYTYEEARDRFALKAEQLASDVADLPDAACPNGEAVALLTLHPKSTAPIAKSYWTSANR